MNQRNSLVAAIDVGTFDNWGMAINDIPPQGITENRLVYLQWIIERIATELDKKSKLVALGFESPLWVPVRRDAPSLLKARKGESSRSWSAGAGATVLATSLPVMSWWFSEISNKMHEQAKATTDPKHWVPGTLFVWEAYVSGTGKTKGDDTMNQHDRDASDAIAAFLGKENIHKSDLSCEEDERIFSTVSQCLKFSGYEIVGDANFPTIVVKS